jgi:hypothetical protein
MDNSSKKHEEILMTEEEPIPEEYKQSKFQINSNAIKPSISTAYNTSKKFQALSGPNIVLSSKPNVNNINNINSMNKKLYTDNNINNKNKNNNSITLSRVSKAKTTLSNYDNSKYENYNLEKMRYDFLKKYSYIHVDKDENFLNRMKFDIFKRQSKEEKINALVEQNKAKIDEDERVSTFNRLISDANRRIEAQDNLENMKNKLSEDIINTDKKKYNYEVWNEIYNKRFKNYAENCNKKKEEEYKKKEILRKKEEIDEINLCKSKKKPQKLIDEASKRMYDEAKRRKIKMNEKIDRINKYNNEIEDASKYTKKIKSESYTFIDEDDLNDNTNNNRLSYNDFYVGKNIVNKKEKIRKTKGMSVSEFNNKRFDKRPRTGKSYNGKSINNKMNQKYFNDYMKKNEQFYNLEKEKNNNIINLKNNNGASSNIVEEFFLRQINDNEDNFS